MGLFFVVALSGIHGAQERRVALLCAELRNQVAKVFPTALDGKLEAGAVYVYNFDTNTELYARQATVPLPLASLTKLMTVRIAAQRAVNMNSLYTITESDLAPEGAIGFAAGDTYSIASLAQAALIKSSNDAAEALARSTGLSVQDFFATMRAEAASLELSTLTFATTTGLDTADGVAQAYGSAADTTFLLQRNVKDFPGLMATSAQPSAVIRSTTGTTISLSTTNEALEKLPLLKAGKTGYTLSAGGNLSVLWDSEEGLIGATVLGSSYPGRFSDMILIADTVRTHASAQKALPAMCH